MNIVGHLLKAIPTVDEANKKVLSDLLTKQLLQMAEEKEPIVSKEQQDLQELLNYNGGGEVEE